MTNERQDYILFTTFYCNHPGAEDHRSSLYPKQEPEVSPSLPVPFIMLGDLVVFAWEHVDHYYYK